MRFSTKQKNTWKLHGTDECYRNTLMNHKVNNVSIVLKHSKIHAGLVHRPKELEIHSTNESKDNIYMMGIWRGKKNDWRRRRSLFEIVSLKTIWCGDIFKSNSFVLVWSWPWTQHFSHVHPNRLLGYSKRRQQWHFTLLLLLLLFISVYRILFATVDVEILRTVVCVSRSWNFFLSLIKLILFSLAFSSATHSFTPFSLIRTLVACANAYFLFVQPLILIKIST